MYAIVEIKGQQFKAEEGKFLYVHHLGADVEGRRAVASTRFFFSMSTAMSKSARLPWKVPRWSARVLVPLVKGDKVIVFRSAAAKGYRRLNGHRQQFSKVMIKKIVTA